MKKLMTIALAAMVAVSGLVGVGSPEGAAAADDTVYTPSIDATSYIKNPGMGWQLYIEEFSKPIISADVFWGLVDEYAWAATDLYLRVPWSRMEPTEGNYAWDNDENYKAIVQGAKARGIKLAFRIVPDSQDVHMQATPQFVFDAGATGYATASNASFKTPYVTDPVFRAKLNAFIAAFGEEYNDPDVVDYIDANGLGWWGEMSSVRNGQTREVLEWITGEYAKAFPDVMLAMNYPSGFNKADQDAMIAKYDLAIRRDGLGSTQWMNEAEKQEIANKFLAGTSIIGENCYQNMETRATACDSSFKKPSMAGMLQRVIDDAKKVRANTMDLRWPEDDVPLWLDKNRRVWNDFALNGGYRLAPSRISVPTGAVVGETLMIEQSWVNGGLGRLPNRTGGWHDKYRVSYALLDSVTNDVVSQAVDMRSNPGDWIKGQTYTNVARMQLGNVEPGVYKMAYSIVDTSKGNEPAISLAVCDEGVDKECPAPATDAFINVVDDPRWYELGAITVAPRVTATVTSSVSATATATTTATVTSSTTATTTSSTTATATSSTTATATSSTTATTTVTSTSTPTVTATSSTTATVTSSTTATVTGTSSPTVVPSSPADVYNTAGFHFVNGRFWYTRCEPYSQTTRCFTDIWATQVSNVNGKWVQKNAWVFNNLTYLPSPRSLWAGNPLAEKTTWVDAEGTKWRTECDTALTGRNGCRSFMWAPVVVAKKGDSGVAWTTKWDWRFNNMVRFS